MILTHLNKRPKIDRSAYIAPTATVCGDVEIGPGCRIMFGACVVSEGAPLRLGAKCIVMENAVIRSTNRHPAAIGAHCLIGPNSHLVGCTLEESVFVATGAAILHGAHLAAGSEVQVNGVVHICTRIAPHATLPIGWIAVGDPAQFFPPGQHDAIWAVQEPLNFPEFVYGVPRGPQGRNDMTEITRKRAAALASHATDKIVGK